MKREIRLLCLIFILSSITGESFSQDKVHLNEGRALVFSSPGDSGQVIKRNYIGIDLFETIFGSEYWVDFGNSGRLDRFHLSYERLSKTGATGFAVELLLSRNNSIDSGSIYYEGARWYGNWFFTEGMDFSYAPFNCFLKAGFNYYPFNYSLNHASRVRFLCGISLLAGDLNKYQYSDYYDEVKNVFVVFLISNLDIKIYLSRSVQFKAGIDMSLLPFLVFVAPELGFSIGF
jgi:hypothetical protein